MLQAISTLAKAETCPADARQEVGPSAPAPTCLIEFLIKPKLKALAQVPASQRSSGGVMRFPTSKSWAARVRGVFRQYAPAPRGWAHNETGRVYQRLRLQLYFQGIIDNWGLSLVPVENLLGKFVAKLFDKDFRPRPLLLLILGAVFLAVGVALFWSAHADNALVLPPPRKGAPAGRGLLDHFGFQAAFISGPLVLGTTLFALGLFLQIVRDVDELVIPGTSPALIRGLIKPQVASLLLRGRWQAMLWLLVIIGIGVSLVIFNQLEHPENYWGNDVFNAKSHYRSYYAANAYLLVLWGLIYPVGVFYAVHLTLSTEIIVSSLMRRQLIRLNFLHVDRCGGMARFGTLNVVIMLIYVWPACAVYALHVTHKYTYASLVIGAVAVSAALIAQSLYGIYWVARTIRAQRESAVNGLNKRIKDSMDDGKHNFTAAVATMEYRDRVLAVSPYPYAGAALALVNVLRVAPAAIAFVRVLI